MKLNLFNHDKEVKKFAPGEIIIRENDPGDIMYIIRAGEIIIQVNGQKVDHLSSGEYLGEMALIENDHIRSATAIAKTDCQLIVIHKKRFLFMGENNPHLALDLLMNILGQRLRKMEQKFVSYQIQQV